ncbi:uncharacterized protein LOC141674455 [Apium graveolens]|uniref:uncharacterized protein LOC141674455 n=1 Tax=Apium graveolens TaxID=4045 RepID=UPI003D7B67A6
MTNSYNFIEDITALSQTITIKDRIIQLWRPPSFKNPNEDGSIEMVVTKFKPPLSIVLLEDFLTSVRCEDDISIQVHGFKFASFDDILSNKLGDKFLIDVIVRVVGYSSVESSLNDNKETKKLIMELEDAEKKSLKCTLWDKYAQNAFNFLSESNTGPLFLIIRNAKIKEWGEVVTLSNSLFCTCLSFNGDYDELKAFKSRFMVQIPVSDDHGSAS